MWLPNILCKITVSSLFIISDETQEKKEREMMVNTAFVGPKNRDIIAGGPRKWYLNGEVFLCYHMEGPPRQREWCIVLDCSFLFLI